MSITEIEVDLLEIAPDFITTHGEYGYHQWTDTLTNKIRANLRALDPDLLAVTVDTTPLRSASDKGLALLLISGLVAVVTAGGATYAVDPAKTIKIVQEMWETLKKHLPHHTKVSIRFDKGETHREITVCTDNSHAESLLKSTADIFDNWETSGGPRVTFAAKSKMKA